ncbi:hypothetical protein FND50_20990 [Rhodococcus sp. WB9]|uniref:hypothetical protein n=1 Tax=Rhodococcus sp. WB9 TaxID=2594007 RepID=UPI0011853301|nr:hypothetical protein [Rhodococcus sp. WB9]QDQ92986.1 hypothetical protein FND50_20990 [Rhodococcus sp. WB9]
MSANDGDLVGVLEWSESVALATMQVSLMQSDIGATKSDKTVAVKEALLGDAATSFHRVVGEDRPDRPDWLTPLLLDMDTQEAAANAIAEHGRRLPPLFESRERSLLVLVDLVVKGSTTPSQGAGDAAAPQYRRGRRRWPDHRPRPSNPERSPAGSTQTWLWPFSRHLRRNPRDVGRLDRAARIRGDPLFWRCAREYDGNHRHIHRLPNPRSGGVRWRAPWAAGWRGRLRRRHRGRPSDRGIRKPVVCPFAALT